MKTASRQFRSGFTGLEILFPLFLLVLIFSALASLFSPTPPGRQTSGNGNQAAQAARTVGESARAGTALIRLGQAADANAPADAAPAATPIPDTPPVDTPIADPGPGDGMGDILGGILDGL